MPTAGNRQAQSTECVLRQPDVRSIGNDPLIRFGSVQLSAFLAWAHGQVGYIDIVRL